MSDEQIPFEESSAAEASLPAATPVEPQAPVPTREEESLLQAPPIPKTHAEHVSSLATLLFDRTRTLHDLRGESRRVLEIAALIHNVPFPPGKKT